MRVIVCGSLLVATVLVQSAPGAAAPRRLNILWICADDHAPYVIGTYGNQRVHTPNIDRLAGGGIRFDRAYCSSPVCTASRDSFITGRYPRTIGVTQLNTPLPESETTLAQVLKRAGYDTGAIGKMHFNSAHTYGFDLRRDLGMYDKAVAKRGKKPIPQDIAVQPRWKPFHDPASIWLNSDDLPSAAVDADMDASYFVEEATGFLSQPHAKPFFLMVSFYEPHSPYYFPIEDRGRFQPSSFPVPPVGPEDADQIPAVFRDLTPAQKQGIAAAYYTSVGIPGSQSRAGARRCPRKNRDTPKTRSCCTRAITVICSANMGGSRSTAVTRRRSATPSSCGVPGPYRRVRRPVRSWNSSTSFPRCSICAG